MKMRGLMLIFASFVLTFFVITNAWSQKKQFYPTIVYLTKSSPCVAVLYVQAFVFALLFAKFIRKVFFGQLRPAETEHLIERSWYAVTDTCLAFTMFRDDFSPIFVGAFTLLLFLKSFHWLLEDRVDYMERSPRITFIFKLRVLSLLATLFLSDLFFVNLSYHSTITKGPSVQIVFGFEYAILATIVLTIFLKYVLHSIDLQNENPWENKALYMLYVELITGFLRVLLYICFTVLMVKVHTFPLFSIRPMYLTMRQFKKAVTDIILSRRAIRNMNSLYPDATAEELSNADNTCIICREEMEAPNQNNPAPIRGVSDAGVNKKLPCGHIFHAPCLRSWFQRQQTCPTCRLDVLQSVPASNESTPAPAAPAAANVPPNPQPPVPPPFPPPMFPHIHPNLFPRFSNNEPTPSSTSPDASPQFITSFPPMPPLFGVPPFVPPPSPPLQFIGMSEDELREMEGQERRHVEARIECLRNINQLLDAAMTQITQYMTVAGMGHSRTHFQFSPPNPSASVSTTMATEDNHSTVSDKGDQGSSFEMNSKQDIAGTSTKLEAAGDTDISNNADSSSCPDHDELRRRRLAKLSASTRHDTSVENS